MRKLSKKFTVNMCLLLALCMTLGNVVTAYAGEGKPEPVTEIQDVMEDGVAENVKDANAEKDKAVAQKGNADTEYQKIETAVASAQAIKDDASNKADEAEEYQENEQEKIDNWQASFNGIVSAEAIEMAEKAAQNVSGAAITAADAADKAQNALEMTKNAENKAQAEEAAKAAESAANDAATALEDAKNNLDAVTVVYDAAKKQCLELLAELLGEEYNAEKYAEMDLQTIYDEVSQIAQDNVEDSQSTLQQKKNEIDELDVESLSQQLDDAKANVDAAATAAQDASDAAKEAAEKVANMHVTPAEKELNEKQMAVDEANAEWIETQNNLVSINEEQNSIITAAESNKSAAKQKLDNVETEKGYSVSQAKALKDKYENPVYWGEKICGEPFYKSKPIEWAREVQKVGVGGWIGTDYISKTQYNNAMNILSNYEKATAVLNAEKDYNSAVKDADRTIEQANQKIQEAQDAVDAAKTKYDTAVGERDTAQGTLESKIAYRDAVLAKLTGDTETDLALLAMMQQEVSGKSDIYNEIYNDIASYIWAADTRDEFHVWEGKWYEAVELRWNIEEKYWSWKSEEGTWIVFKGTEKNLEFLNSVKDQAKEILKSVEEEQAMLESAYAAKEAQKAALEAQNAKDNAEDAKATMNSLKKQLQDAKDKANSINITGLDLAKLKENIERLQAAYDDAKAAYIVAEAKAKEADDYAKEAAELVKNFATFYVVLAYDENGNPVKWKKVQSGFFDEDNYIVYPGTEYTNWQKPKKLSDGWHIDGEYTDKTKAADVFLLKPVYSVTPSGLGGYPDSDYTPVTGFEGATLNRKQIFNMDGISEDNISVPSDAWLFENGYIQENETVVWYAVKIATGEDSWHIDGKVVEKKSDDSIESTPTDPTPTEPTPTEPGTNPTPGTTPGTTPVVPTTPTGENPTGDDEIVDDNVVIDDTTSENPPVVLDLDEEETPEGSAVVEDEKDSDAKASDDQNSDDKSISDKNPADDEMTMDIADDETAQGAAVEPLVQTGTASVYLFYVIAAAFLVLAFYLKRSFVSKEN